MGMNCYNIIITRIRYTNNKFPCAARTNTKYTPRLDDQTLAEKAFDIYTINEETYIVRNLFSLREQIESRKIAPIFNQRLTIMNVIITNAKDLTKSLGSHPLHCKFNIFFRLTV